MLDRARLEAIVREAGRMALDLWPGHSAAHGEALERWEKAPGNPVCAADIAVDTFLRRELRAMLPAAGWLSEETADAPERLGGGLIWLVDPIDGTRDYLRGRTGWAVSVALVSAGRPLAGILFAPAREAGTGGEYWYGEAGQGSWRNGRRLAASRHSALQGARVPADAIAPEDSGLIQVEKPNSIALRIAKVAADEADLVATLRWGWEWDIGAAALIAREAGAVVTDAFGAPLNYNKPDPRAFGVLAASPVLHASAAAHVAERAARLSRAG